MKRTVAILFGQLTLAATVGFLAQPLPATGALLDGGGLRRQVPATQEAGQRLAQEASPVPGQRERRQARMKEVESELEKNPNLVDDPDYMKHHPGLAKMFEKHPEAKDKLKQDPKAFFQHLEEQHRQRTSGSGGSEAGGQGNPE